MTRTAVRFAETVSWEPTEAETAALDALAVGIERIEEARAVLDAAEATALTMVAQIANVQMARSGDSAYTFPRRAAASEIAARLREPSGALQRRIDDAEILVTRFPATQQALSEGRITRKHVNVIRDAGINLHDPDVRAEFESRTVAFAEDASPGQLRPFASLLAEQLAPGSLSERRARARASRGVWTRDLPDGMAELALRDSAETVHGIFNRLTAMAKTVKAAADRTAERAATPQEGLVDAHDDERMNAFGMHVAADGTVVDGNGYACHPDTASADEHIPAVDSRTLEQVRADLAADLLLTGTPGAHVVEGDCTENRLGAITATVQVVIPVESLAGLGDDGAFLTGYGALAPDVARRFAKHAPGWERVFQNPDTGALETVDHYVPTAAIRRLVEVRDETCRFLYCRQPAARCDKDHTIEHSRGGPTHHGNLECLCRSHHMLRHHGGWRPEHLGDGTIRWTSPLGLQHDALPPRPAPGTSRLHARRRASLRARICP